ncbi:hypothetical protein [Bifidobacterium dentium]|uniref:hypothetical protein n=1 Tax=Bifidobacterium dentium TaxID=1689 RepID=UPI0018B0BF96|nr:hypothetical protein [Bifidobacterium dentium]MBF9690490.1 hypothetical protein [Bifidobacterium dentium]
MGMHLEAFWEPDEADEHDRLLARFRDSDDAFGLRAQTVSLCEISPSACTHASR